MGVREAGHELDLAEEAISTDLRRDLRTQDFQRNEPVVTQIARKKHDRHPALTEHPLDRVLSRYSGL
jgi:hypothetical protein